MTFPILETVDVTFPISAFLLRQARAAPEETRLPGAFLLLAPLAVAFILGVTGIVVGVLGTRLKGDESLAAMIGIMLSAATVLWVWLLWTQQV